MGKMTIYYAEYESKHPEEELNDRCLSFALLLEAILKNKNLALTEKLERQIYATKIYTQCLKDLWEKNNGNRNC